MKSRELAAYLSSRDIAGVSFMARKFTPAAGTFSGQELEAVEILLLDRNRVKPVQLGLELVAGVLKLHPGKFDPKVVSKLIGNDETLRALAAGDDPRAIAAKWKPAEERFRSARAKYLLYK
jgi:uncharacterized protein YbbC (DUF1343 family)